MGDQKIQIMQGRRVGSLNGDTLNQDRQRLLLRKQRLDLLNAKTGKTTPATEAIDSEALIVTLPTR